MLKLLFILGLVAPFGLTQDFPLNVFEENSHFPVGPAPPLNFPEVTEAPEVPETPESTEASLVPPKVPEALVTQPETSPKPAVKLQPVKPTAQPEIPTPVSPPAEPAKRRTPRPRPSRRPRPTRPTRQQSRDSAFSSFLFTLQWPPALRKDSPRHFNDQVKPNLNIEDWTILSLAPDETNRCRNEQKFDMSLLSDRLADLTQRWPSFLKSRTAEQFWKAQWSRHGVCANMSISGYFGRALDLNEIYPIGEWLASAMVLPSSDDQYGLKDLTRAFTGHIEATQFILKCKDVSDGREGRKHLLREVTLCLAKDGVNLTDCKKKHSCKETFYYLPASASGRK